MHFSMAPILRGPIRFCNFSRIPLMEYRCENVTGWVEWNPIRLEWIMFPWIAKWILRTNPFENTASSSVFKIPG